MVSLSRMLEGRGLAIKVDSAGFIGPDRECPRQAQDVARERHLDLAECRSKIVTRELASASDLVVVMEPGQVGDLRQTTGRAGGVVVLGDLDPLPVDRRDIPDPWGKDLEAFRNSFDRIDRCLEELLDLLDPEGPRSARGV